MNEAKKKQALPVTRTLHASVTEEMLAIHVGSGTLRVLGTPVLARLYEQAAQELAGLYCDAGTTTVGTAISLSHDAPTPCGMEFSVTVTLVKHEGRLFEFALEAADATGPISKGTHTRVAVYAEKFQAKADAKGN
jgi:fluoroacetyl-CoA thioesterase